MTESEIHFNLLEWNLNSVEECHILWCTVVMLYPMMYPAKYFLCVVHIMAKLCLMMNTVNVEIFIL